MHCHIFNKMIKKYNVIIYINNCIIYNTVFKTNFNIFIFHYISLHKQFKNSNSKAFNLII